MLVYLSRALAWIVGQAWWRQTRQVGSRRQLEQQGSVLGQPGGLNLACMRCASELTCKLASAMCQSSGSTARAAGQAAASRRSAAAAATSWLRCRPRAGEETRHNPAPQSVSITSSRAANSFKKGEVRPPFPGFMGNCTSQTQSLQANPQIPGDLALSAARWSSVQALGSP